MFNVIWAIRTAMCLVEFGIGFVAYIFFAPISFHEHGIVALFDAFVTVCFIDASFIVGSIIAMMVAHATGAHYRLLPGTIIVGMVIALALSSVLFIFALKWWFIGASATFATIFIFFSVASSFLAPLVAVAGGQGKGRGESLLLQWAVAQPLFIGTAIGSIAYCLWRHHPQRRAWFY